MLKKILKITGYTLLALIIILFTAPYIFKGKIIKIVKQEINKSINAKVDFKDLSLSFFRHFPKASVALDQLEVVGLGEFSKDTLISAREIDAAVDLLSLISGDEIRVHSVNIHAPRIHALVNKEGRANWDIMKPDTSSTTETTEEPSSFQLNLKKYAITDAYVLYDDASSGMSSEILQLDHEGSGDFTADLFTLQTKTRADAVTFTYGGIPYLARTRTSIDADIEIDSKTSKYGFETDEIALNDLKLSSKGFFQLVNDSTYNMDISFKAPSTEFKTILSLVPAIYQQDFDKVKTSGKAIFEGFVKGIYSNTQMPAYSLLLDVQDGFFQYPDLPRPVQHINLLVKVDNPDGETDHVVVDLSKGHIEFGNDPFDFHFLVKNPISNLYLDAAAKGKLDLAGITQFVKLGPGTKLAGLVNADIVVKGNMSGFQQAMNNASAATGGQPTTVKAAGAEARGFIDLSNIYYASGAFPQPIQNTRARIEVENADGIPDHTVVRIPSAHVEVGADAADLTLNLRTPLSDPAFEGTLKGGFNLGSVAQFYTFEPGTSLAGKLQANGSFKGKKSMIDKSQYDALQLAGNVQLADMVYTSKDYPDGVAVKNSQLSFNPKNVTLSNLSGSFLQTNFNANGSFDNLIGYALKDEPLAGTLNVSADKVDLNKFMGATSEDAPADTAGSSSGPFLVPKNISLTLNTKVDNLKYDKVDYNNINGSLQLQNETVSLKNVQLQALDGNIALNGSYSTRVNKQKPDVTLTYDVQNLDIQKTFLAFNTVQKLMPIGQFIAGKLSSKLTMKGQLGGDMMPDLSSLTGEGNLLLLQGVLSKFGPLDKLASTLNITDLQNISIKDIKNYFEFANGKVLVKPFNVKVKDMDLEIGGTHGLDQSLDYVINMKVPREKLGTQANQLINSLASQASSKGIPVNVGETVNLKVNLGGTIKSPTVKTNLKEAGSSLAQDMKEQANEFVEAKKKAADSALNVAKAAAKDTLESVKKQLLESAAEEAKKALLGKKDTTTQGGTDKKKAAEESVKGLLNNILKKKTDTTKKQ
ncbi:MAG: AsmA-like C-terminal region-containing protein [Candidatus Pseudobacter hemicellulosilyticus]|uniref:AsmA-like C-terminal region-containing protein n=1 Tax=Candidatus Pseudobacter hemicellulosilyticus TaxID=3121375 RepID=A0AAJ6BES9_9BACT|nr:MAG: AsmA-like C-terminal region-containing protein [Pseudobacter sp.]